MVITPLYSHWAFAKDLELLTPAKIDQWLSNQNRKKGDLRKAYELARDPVSWNDEQNTVVKNHEIYLQEEADAEEENEDQLQEEEEDADADEREAGKRRKRPAETGKVRESATKSKKPKVAEAAKSKSTDKANTSVDANGDVTAADETLDPETRKVKDWRMKLQKAFLPKSEQIREADMPQLDSVFKTVEEFDAITADQLRATKIGKVTKKIMHLPNVPRDDEFHFRARAEKLCVKWGAIMAASGSTHENGTTPAAEKTEEEPQATATKSEAEQEPKQEPQSMQEDEKTAATEPAEGE